MAQRYKASQQIKTHTFQTVNSTASHSSLCPGQNFALPIAEVQGGTQRVSLRKVATTNLSSSATGGNQIPIVQPAGSHLTSRAIQHSVVTQRGTVLDKLTVS